MRVLCTTLAMPSHYYPMMGLLTALRAAGHDVRVAGQPSVMDVVTATGFTGVAVGGGYDILTGFADARQAKKDATTPEQEPAAGADALARMGELRMRKHTMVAADMAPALVEFSRWWRPNLVVTDPLVYAAVPAAAVVGAPLLRHQWGVDNVRQVALPGNGIDEAEDPRARWPDELVDLYASYGAKPACDIAMRTLDICPDRMQVPGIAGRVPMRFVPYNGSTVVPRWLCEPGTRPRVVVTSGAATTAVLGPSRFVVPQVLDALAGLDVAVVVAVTPADREQLTDVGPGVRVLSGMPLDVLLPGCAAVVHHAGAGTTLTAAVHGVPQVTVPQLPGGQTLVSDQLAATGAGISVPGADPDAVRAALTRVLADEAPRAAAQQLRSEIMATPSPAAVVGMLEELIA